MTTACKKFDTHYKTLKGKLSTYMWLSSGNGKKELYLLMYAKKTEDEAKEIAVKMQICGYKVRVLNKQHFEHGQSYWHLVFAIKE